MYRNRFVDILKGILIIFVIVLHTWIEPETRLALGFPFWINMTVPMFMLISGYVCFFSMEKVGEGAVEKAYYPRKLLGKMLRFCIPFSIAFIVEWIVFRCFGLYTVGIIEYGIFSFFLDFFRGGYGQGSYYFPIMIQFIFLFPTVYYVIKKYRFNGLLFFLGTNAFYEVLKIAFGMNDYEYRFLIFRYLFVIASGCYIASGDWKKIKKERLIILSVICMLIGLLFTYLFSYTDYQSKIITYWRGTSFLNCMYLVPIMGWLLSKFQFGCKIFELIGKASFNIFLIQMIYYNFLEQTYKIIPNVAIHLIVSILNCVLVGIAFYYFENKLTKYIINKLVNI